jgi:uncharacterized membrane protein
MNTQRKKRKYFLTGLLIVMPVLITIYLFVSLFAFIDNILGRYLSWLTIDYLGYKIPGLGILVFLILVSIIGFFATNFIGRRLFLYMEKFWFKFPVIKKIYPAAKQITHFLFSSKIQGQFQKVALVEYPSKGIYSIGFVTNQGAKEIEKKLGKEMLNILIPSVPNPITGMMIVVPRSDAIFLDMSVEEAIKIIVSGGVLNPGQVLSSTSPAQFFLDD